MIPDQKPTHRYLAYRDGEQTACWPDDGTLFTKSLVQQMRDLGHTVIRQRIPETPSA